MRFACTLIAIFAFMLIAYGNKAANEKKKESAIQGKQINLYYFVFLPKNLFEMTYLTLMSKDRNEMKTKCFR